MLANVIPVAPLPAPRIALDKDVRADPKPSTERTSDAGRTRSVADLTPGVAIKPGALAPADGGKSERNERAGGGAADSRLSTPAQALAGTAAINLQAPLVEKLVPEAPAQQILRQLSAAEPVFTSIPQAHDVHAAPRSMRLKLSPENLGEVEIRITREEGRLSIRIRAEQRETAEMLKNDSSFLLERLEFSAGPDRHIEIEFAGVADAGQHREATDRSGGSLEGGANRQAAEREAVPHDASAPRKSAGSSQDHADPDLDLQTPRGRPDVLLL